MERIIEFLIPADFKPTIKWVPQEERGRLVVFPSNLREALYVQNYTIFHR
jgi:hypothetical protein